jgi:hypothetical protein
MSLELFLYQSSELSVRAIVEAELYRTIFTLEDEVLQNTDMSLALLPRNKDYGATKAHK